VLPSRMLPALLLLPILGLSASQARPQDPRAVFDRAQRALLAGNYEKAEEGFREVLELDPLSAAAYSNLGVIYLRTNKLDAAIESLQAARKLAPQVVGINLNLGLAYYRKKAYPEAIPYFDHVLQAYPVHEQARFLKGMCHFVLSDYEPTVRTLEPLYAQEKNNLDFLFVMGICYGKLKRDTDSEKAFAQLVRVGGDTPHMHLLLGKAYLDLYVNQKARDELDKAVADDPKLPYGHFNLGVVYQRLGMLEEAGREFDAEISITPSEPWTYENRGTVYLAQDNPDPAIEMFLKALALNPKMPLSLAGLGKAYVRKGQVKDAIPYLEKAVALQSDSANMHYQLGQAYLKTGRRAEAKKEMDEAGRLQAEAREKQEEKISGKLPAPEAPGQQP
jgi:tetratricopeptide (TPR) repeat protein